MNTKIDLADVAILQYDLVSSIGRIMCSAVVQGAPCWECDTRFEPIRLHQRPCPVLDHFTDLSHGHAGLYVTTSIPTDLAMNLCTPTSVVVLIKVLSLQCTLFLVRGSPEVARYGREIG